LAKLGFVFLRQRGSHAILRRDMPDGARGCVVPMHSEIQPGTLRGILKQAGVELEDFIAQL
jgi:predicted RNA binding protein YcfA (HicA-like mRNA interferase family)